MKKTKHKIISYTLLITIILIITLSSYFSPQIKDLFTPSNIRQFLLSLGFWGYFVFIALIIISVPTPAPSTPIILAGGYVYGTWAGVLLALIAGALGGTIAFYLARWYGKPLISRLVDNHHLVHFNHLFKKRGESIAFISFAVPIFPSDVLTFLLGLTSIGYWRFMAIMNVAHIPRYFIIAILGNDFFAGITMRTIIVFAFAIVFVLIAIFRERLKKMLFKELRIFEKDVTKIEKEVF